MLNYNDINQAVTSGDYLQIIGGQTTLTYSTLLFTRVAYYQYTPILSSSYILVEYNTEYTTYRNNNIVNNTLTTESYVSVLKMYNTSIAPTWSGDISSSTIALNCQVHTPTGTTQLGMRSGTMFPLMGRYTNTDLTPKYAIVASLIISDNSSTVNDLLIFRKASGSTFSTIPVFAGNEPTTWMKITEIAR